MLEQSFYLCNNIFVWKCEDLVEGVSCAESEIQQSNVKKNKNVFEHVTQMNIHWGADICCDDCLCSVEEVKPGGGDSSPLFATLHMVSN